MEVFQTQVGHCLENARTAFSDYRHMNNPVIARLWFTICGGPTAKINEKPQNYITASNTDGTSNMTVFIMTEKAISPAMEWIKLWWVHIRTLISLLSGYQLTFRRMLAWSKNTRLHLDINPIIDGGYLNRQGEVLLKLKGGKWKGCFHVPRGLYQCWKTLEKINRTKHELIH